MARTAGSEVLELLVQLRDEASGNVRKLNDVLGGLEKKASATSRVLGGLRQGFGRLSSIAFSLKGALAGLGATLIARSFVQAASTSENYRVRLVRLLGSVKEGNRLFDAMADYASKVSFQFEDIQGSAVALSGVMKGGVDEIRQWMPMIGDLAAASGLGIQETTQQVIRMYSAGAASADLFRERGVLAMLGFQAGVSYSAKETREQLIKAFEDPLSKFRGAATDLGTTWEGGLSMMADGWFAFRNMVMNAGVFDFLRAGLLTAIEYMNKFKEDGSLQEWATKLGKSITTGLQYVIKAVGLVADAFRGWQMIWDGLKIGFAAFAQFLNKGIAFYYDTMSRALDAIGEKVNDLAQFLSELGVAGISDKLVQGLDKVLQRIRSARDTTKAMSDATQQGVQYWADVKEESSAHLQQVAMQQSYYSKSVELVDKLKNKAAELAAKAKETADNVKSIGGRPAETAKYENQLKSTLERTKATTETALAHLDIFYKNNLISLDEYYSKRESMLQNQFNKEISYYQKLAELEEDPNKKLALQDKVFAAQEAFDQKLLALRESRAEKEKAIEQAQMDNEKMLLDLRSRAAGDSTAAMSVQFDNELALLKMKHEEELRALEERNATKAQLEEAFRLQQLEKDEVLAQQRQKIHDTTLRGIQTTLGSMEEAFATAYEASGKKSKEFFVAQKAVMIAQTIMSTYQAAQSAFTSLAGIPYVGPALGIAAAAAAVAAGLARVAAIRNQNLATGGMVEGFSPTPTSDNVPINATAGEWVHPVSSVKYYGEAVMRALQTKAIPREFFTGLSIPNLSSTLSRGRLNFATGGQVSGPSDDRSAAGGEKKTNIINVLDPQVFQQWSASAAGQRNILNAMSENLFEVKQMILGD